MNQHKTILLMLGCLLPFVGCKTPPTGAKFDPYRPTPAEAFQTVQLTNQVNPAWLEAPTDFYTVGPGDVLQVEVVGEPQSRASAIVGPDGKIYYSLLPGLSVWGLTLSQTKALVEDRMAKYIKNKPEIHVSLVSATSKQIWILGEVHSPGVYPLTAPLTVLSAVAAAKGFTTPSGLEETVDLRSSFIMREGRPLPVDMYGLFRNGDLSQNVYLLPDDFVYLRSSAAKEVYVLGAVTLPSPVAFVSSASLVSAIASAGGPVEYAYLTHIAIVRGSMSHPTIAIADFKNIVAGNLPDIPLQPGDIVYVPWAPFRKVEILAEQVFTQFVRTIAVNEGANAVARNRQPITISAPLAQ